MHNLKGRRFGRLEVIGIAGRKHSRLLWSCKCDCGNVVNITSNRLLHKEGTKSCGCIRKEVSAQKATKHGMSHTRIYKIWSGMKKRCQNPNNQAYDHYGGRGIKVCDRWMDFDNFYEDMHSTYQDDLTIDRINNDGNYDPSNCRWATQGEQVNNTRRCVFITIGSQTDSVRNMCKKHNANYDKAVRLIKSGIDPVEAINKCKAV